MLVTLSYGENWFLTHLAVLLWVISISFMLCFVWGTRLERHTQLEDKLMFCFKDKLIRLIERTFQSQGSPYLACNDRNAFFFTSEKPKNIMHGPVKMYVMRWSFCWTTFLFHLAPSCIDKKLGYLWALIVLPWLQIYSCFVMRGTLLCLFLMISRLMLLMRLTLHPNIWTIF